MPLPEPGKADPSPVDVPPGEARLNREIARLFKADPEVIELGNQIVVAKIKLDAINRMIRIGGDPAVRKAEERLKALQTQYDQLRELKSAVIREQITDNLTPRNREEAELAELRRHRKVAEIQKAEAQRDLAKSVVDRNAGLQAKNPNFVSKEDLARAEAELRFAEAELAGKKAELDQSDPLRSRRDARAADVAKAKAQLDLARAIVDRNAGLQTKNPNFVSKEEVTRAEAELKIAEAELAGKQAELDEADLLLNRARLAPAAEAAPDSRPIAAAPVSGGTLADLRDAVELMEVQLQGKQAELQGGRR